MYIPGFTNMLMRPDLLQGGPAYADMMPGAMPEQVSMLPFAPEAPAPQPMMQPPSGLGGRQDFMDARDIYMGDAPDRFSQSMNMENYVEPQRDPVTGLLLNAQGQQGFQFMTDRGRQAGFGSGNTGFLTADPNAQYRMRDERGKNRTVSEGTGVDALRNIYNLANQFNKEQGKKANWGIERLNPTTGRWERVAENDPAKGTGIVGDIIGGALPLAALAIPGLNVLGTIALGAGLGGAGAGIAGNNVLKGAVMGGLSAAGGQILGPALDIGSKATSAAIGTGLGATAGGLATGQSLKNSLIGGALAGAGSFAAGELANQLRAPSTGPTGGGSGGGGGFDASNIVITPTSTVSFTPPPISGSGSRIIDKQVAAEPVITNDGMVLTGSRGALGQMTSGAPGLGDIFSPSAFAQTNPIGQEAPPMSEEAPPTPEEAITVTGDRITNMAGGTPSLKAVPGALNTIPQPLLDAVAAENAPRENEIVVTDTKLPTAPAVPLTPADVASDFDKEFGKKSLGDKLKDRVKNLDAADYLELAGILLPLLDRDKGGRRGALGTIPSGMFGKSSVFGGGLPRPTLPGATGNFAPRAPSALGPQTTQDYYRYGYGPAQSFFDYVPQGAPNTSRAFTGYEQAQAREDKGFYLGGMAGGGDRSVMPRNSFAVNGPGTGRSDEIPAMLSDGEYVMDAETVALLGDGSPKAGADRLDQFRINVRKDKGRNLVKGEFSANAKRPEHYLKGGRT